MHKIWKIEVDLISDINLVIMKENNQKTVHMCSVVDYAQSVFLNLTLLCTVPL